MAELAERHPADLADLQNAVLRHDFQRAGGLAEKIGPTEEQLVARERRTGRPRAGNRCRALLVAAVVIQALPGSGDAPAPAPAPTDGTDGGLPPGGLPTS